MKDSKLALTSTTTAATTYTFHTTGSEFRSWALCTINDPTGELLITSDWGSWSHRWNASPSALGHPTLTDFIGTRADVDYLARKLQREGAAGRVFSAEATARELRRRLCERRLEDGRCRIEARLEPEEAPPPHLRSRYDDDGLPVFSHRMPAAFLAGRPWDTHGTLYTPIPYLTRAEARRLWNEIGELAADLGEGQQAAALFYERLPAIEGFNDYVTQEPWEYAQTVQTNEDLALRNIILPALIEACAARVARATEDQAIMAARRDISAAPHALPGATIHPDGSQTAPPLTLGVPLEYPHFSPSEGVVTTIPEGYELLVNGVVTALPARVAAGDTLLGRPLNPALATERHAALMADLGGGPSNDDTSVGVQETVDQETGTKGLELNPEQQAEDYAVEKLGGDATRAARDVVRDGFLAGYLIGVLKYSAPHLSDPHPCAPNLPQALPPEVLRGFRAMACALTAPQAEHPDVRAACEWLAVAVH